MSELIAKEIERKVNNYLRDNDSHDVDYIILIGDKEYYAFNSLNDQRWAGNDRLLGIKYKRLPIQSTFSIMRLDAYKAVCSSVRRDMMDAMSRVNLLSEQV